MGCDIHSWAEFKKNGKWVRNEEPIFSPGNSYGSNTSEPFSWRSYSLFGFLADVRNYSHCVPISEPKGLPTDSEYLNTPLSEPQNYSYYGYDNGTAYTVGGEIECDANYHSLSHLTLKELLDFDYEQTFWDRRISRTTYNDKGGSFTDGAALANEGEGETITYREHLGNGFFTDLEVLKSLGESENVRIIFYFDN